ncbi:MAG: ABC transporter permease [Rhodopirellula sp.]|nr:ABC transporter permease [Rhodopirellula sp.]OUX49827.1 MAG: ABC transporter permease [Rhodopirellula sp. TMED283]
MSRLIRASMKYSWRVSGSVALGVATATAVIVGALLVGDSMRGSLRGLTIERLGNTENAIFPGGFFELDGLTNTNLDPIALMLFENGIVEFRGDHDEIRRAGSVQIIGCDSNFWRLDVSGMQKLPALDDDSVIVNQSMASELGVHVGDLLTLRLPVEQAVPADSPLGTRDAESEGLPRMRIAGIVPDRGLGIFSVSASQASPRNVFVNRATVGEVLDRKGQANAILLDQPATLADFNISLADLGLTLQRIERSFKSDSGEPMSIYEYFWLTSERLLLPAMAVDRIKEAFPAAELIETTTYLANALERLNQEGEVVATVPYSTITAVDGSPQLPLSYEFAQSSIDSQSPEADNTTEVIPLVLNQWTADRLGATRGTFLRVAYYEPEVKNGQEIERFFTAIVTDVVPITRPATPYRRRREATFDQPPTVYNDPDLTPSVPGVTDQDSISDWDLPFALKREISKEDDDYWNEYRLTPKAFLPLYQGQQLFGSRFGETTGIRFSASSAADESLLSERLLEILKPSFPDLGWSIIPIREQQLAASSGTTPFDGLFLSLSFFVILAAIMLIAMLFRLGLTQRMTQFGTLLAVGWTPRCVARFALREGLLVAAAGVVLGVVGGFLYAWIVLWALRSLWVGAVTVPFLTFHWTLQSLLIGSFAGWAVAAVTLWRTARWLTHLDAQDLLSQRDTDKMADRTSGRGRLPVAAFGLGCLAVGVGAFGATAAGQIAAGAFVGGGMLLLVAALLFIYACLRSPNRLATKIHQDSFTFWQLISRNASRHPLRSTMTIGLMATAAFLIMAISAFRLQPNAEGTGGFTLIGQSSQTLSRDLRQKQVRSEMLGPDARLLAETTIAPLRLRLGQDASCNNLYKATQPTVVGISESFSRLFNNNTSTVLPGFQWAADGDLPVGKTPWDALDVVATGTENDPIPVIIDQNTAMWSLQMMKGVGEVRAFEYEPGKLTYFRVVGLLANSMLQGKLMIGENNFKRIFPDISGYQYFLIAVEHSRSEEVASVLENRLGDIGMDVTDANRVLSKMLAVQNTYLRTFQSLGALGLLLGTIGLAVAQMRSVLERRQELAVMRAIGFSRQRLTSVVMGETATLLLFGIGCGAVCAVLAVLPHALINGLEPPIVEPFILLVGITLFGLCAGLAAVRRVSRMPLLESLRSN